jgi:hypothetical protein
LKDKDEHGQTAADLAWAYQRSYSGTILRDTLKSLIRLSRIKPTQLLWDWYARLNKAGISDREVEELFDTYGPRETYESQKQASQAAEFHLGFTQKEVTELFETHESQKQVPQTAEFHLGFTQKELVDLFETYESESQAPQAAQ